MKTPSAPNKIPRIGLNAANHTGQLEFAVTLPFACMVIHFPSLGCSRLTANRPIISAQKIDIVIMAEPSL